ncbi:Acyl-CoA dehydrogenase, N-terminal domain [Pseudomonas sp. NFACC24-1]|uniref:acyl-CoA dehydrogenase family protein n=1 Tax=Pseudomonas sp. NFACC24-1 TaxID=1566189 RepID=UPI0008E9A110|nr:acyl-CoA dehydrogenase family protein [Pseudomonas sp. NFACC24-1]SFP09080.1 Acyl-CoA dehydrogenase, N-terminal domain [Pseudomonas sp. NFACC24-1]
MSESQAAVREICDAIIKRVDRAYVAECGRKNEFPQKLWDMWVDTGLLSMGLPEEFGGAGGSLKDIVLALDLLHREALLLPIAVTNFMSECQDPAVVSARVINQQVEQTNVLVVLKSAPWQRTVLTWGAVRNVGVFFP